MKNKLIDLNDHLFEQLERLSDEDLKDEELEKELKRTKAMVSIGDKVIQNASLSLEATKVKMEYGLGAEKVMPQMLENKKND